jgi:hypothetical protein
VTFTLSPMDDLEAAWSELHDATPPGWFIGPTAYDGRRDEWSLYSFDATERPKVGRRSRDWTAVAPTQSGVVREMARCLREIGQVAVAIPGMKSCVAELTAPRLGGSGSGAKPPT